MEFETGKNSDHMVSKKANIISDVETTFEINNFVRVRENYFTCLKKAINENSRMHTNSLSEKILEEMSLSLEQPILLCCLRREIYQRLMTDIILEIKKLTGEGVLHLKIKMMLDNPSEKIDVPVGSEIKQNGDFHLPDTWGSTSFPGGFDESKNEGLSSRRTRKTDSEQDLIDSETDKEHDDDYDYVRRDIIDILENGDPPTSTDRTNRENILNGNEVRKGTGNPSPDEGAKFFKARTKHTVWKHEKTIQMHNMSLLLSRRSEEERLKNEIVFLDLFGVDTDVDERSCQDGIYRRSCSERISGLVVRHLMPYYRENRIVGRTIFKKLGHFISEKILHLIEYPDERYVKYFVAKFFRRNKTYKSEGDLLNIKSSLSQR